MDRITFVLICSSLYALLTLFIGLGVFKHAINGVDFIASGIFFLFTNLILFLIINKDIRKFDEYLIEKRMMNNKEMKK